MNTDGRVNGDISPSLSELIQVTDRSASITSILRPIATLQLVATAAGQVNAKLKAAQMHSNNVKILLVDYHHPVRSLVR